MFFKLQKAGINAIIQDHGGKAILATSNPKYNVANAEFIEAIAIFRGL